MKPIDELKELLEGSTILELKEGTGREDICEFFVKKGNNKYSFTLLATDLGYWVENRKNQNGSFLDVQEMFEAIFKHHSDHADFEHDMFKVFDDVLNRTVGFKCLKCDEKYVVGLKAIKASNYCKFLDSPDKRDKVAKALSVGWIGNVDSLVANLEPERWLDPL